MEFGLMSFADMEPEKQAGSGISAHQRIKNLMEEIQLADRRFHLRIFIKRNSYPGPSTKWVKIFFAVRLEL